MSFGRILFGTLLPIGILAGGVAIFLTLASAREEPRREERVEALPLVEVAEVGQGPEAGFPIRVNGTVVPKRDVRLAAEVEGRVVERTDLCWAGRSVEEGDVLFRIDPKPLDYQRQSLDAELLQIEADLAQLEAEIGNNAESLELAREQLGLREREQARVEKQYRQNVSSASELDTAAAAVLTARLNVQELVNQSNLFESRRRQLEARRIRAEAQREELLYDMGRTTITSPVDGVIVEVLVEEDAFVRPGEAVVQIEDTSALEVRCSLQMDELYWLAGGGDPAPSERALSAEDPYRIPHAPAVVSFNLGGRPVRWDGYLARFEGTGIDERTRTIPCRVEVPDPAAGARSGPFRLRRGMFVSVDLMASDLQVPLLSIPKRALQPNDEVWVVRDGKLSIQAVETVRVLEDAILVRGDGPAPRLRPGDRLVVSTLPIVTEGMEVDVAGEEPSEAEAVAALSRNDEGR